VLSRLPAVHDPAVVSGMAAGDDAAIYRIADDLWLVQTVDVFTPCVDDAHLFGRICAANCLSDIYAMGGTPRTALSVLAFPSERLPGEIMLHLLSGAMEVFADAGVALVGGHSLKDNEVKLGFAITGTIDPAVAAMLEKPGVGDLLLLTKPLGTGVLTFARQIRRPHEAGLAAAEVSMATLNRAAAEAMKEVGASACTDVTGFGLFAHLLRMMRSGRRTARVYADALPAFEGALDLLRQGVVPGAVERNREYVGNDLRVEAGVEEAVVNLGFDAQTSGGLLITVPSERLEDLRRALARRYAGGFVIGEIVGESDGEIVLVPDGRGAGVRPAELNYNQPEGVSMNRSVADTTKHGEHCCADVFNREGVAGSAAASEEAYGALMRSVQAAGTLSERTKELILFSLVLFSRCAPCFRAHYRKARDLGISQAELDEAAWCAIAMGGAPVRMFYQESLKSTEAPEPAS
jgi:selenide,water dikinase